MKSYLSLLAIIFPLSIALAVFPFQASFCEEERCNGLGKPCSKKDGDQGLGKCCTGEQTNPNDSSEKYSLKCKEISPGIGTCEKKEE